MIENARSDNDAPSHDAGLPQFAQKARDLLALRDALADSAHVGTGLWLSYLFVLFYLLVAVGSVTHRDLLFEDPIKLPIISVELPLAPFFVVAPVLFLVVHTYVLLHFVLLAGKVGAFHAELQNQIADEDLRTRLQRQLPSNIFAQYLAGPREVREGAVGFLLRAIAQISLIVAPVGLLVLFQVQFLAYHDELITWWHRIALTLDLLIVWTLWPSITGGQIVHAFTRQRLKTRKAQLLAGMSLLTLLFVSTISVFPGEWLERRLPSLYVVPIKEAKGYRWASIHELFMAGEVDLVSRKPKSLFSNRIVLPGLDMMDRSKFDSESKISSLTHTVALRGRHLEGIVLSGSNLRKADFGAAHLQGAVLNGAQLQAASFDNAKLQGAQLDGAYVQMASFGNADLRGASFALADAQLASFNGADLRGAAMLISGLEGATFVLANVDGSSFAGSILHGVNFYGTTINGVDFRNATLWQSDHFQGSDLRLAGATAERQSKVGLRRHVAYEKLSELIEKHASDRSRQELRDRIAVLNCNSQSACQRASASFTKAEDDGPGYLASIVDILADAACSSEFSEAISEGLYRNQRLPTIIRERKTTATQPLNPSPNKWCSSFLAAWNRAVVNVDAKKAK